MGIFIHFEPDTEEELEYKEQYNKYKKLVTSNIYKRIYDSKKLEAKEMRIIYDLLKEDLHG